MCGCSCIGAQSQPGTWCSGITPAQHAGGPGFNPQRVHISRVLRGLWIQAHHERCNGWDFYRSGITKVIAALGDTIHLLRQAEFTRPHTPTPALSSGHNLSISMGRFRTQQGCCRNNPLRHLRLLLYAHTHTQISNTHRGARTHDHKVKGLALYRLNWAA